jgi:hypothetical protein
VRVAKGARTARIHSWLDILSSCLRADRSVTQCRSHIVGCAAGHYGQLGFTVEIVSIGGELCRPVRTVHTDSRAVRSLRKADT